MQEQDVTDWKERLAAYTPETEQERRDRNRSLSLQNRYCYIDILYLFDRFYSHISFLIL